MELVISGSSIQLAVAQSVKGRAREGLIESSSALICVHLRFRFLALGREKIGTADEPAFVQGTMAWQAQMNADGMWEGMVGKSCSSEYPRPNSPDSSLDGKRRRG